MSRAVLSIGSNLGDRLAHLQAALDALADAVDIVGVSGVYETAPVGGPEQDDFLNAVVIVDTTLAPLDLLALCQDVERARDRVRDVRWGPRTLDVDVIDIAGVLREDPMLIVPHPRAHLRAFVCVPWAEVDPAATLPQGPIAALALDRSGVTLREDLVLTLPGGSRS